MTWGLIAARNALQDAEKLGSAKKLSRLMDMKKTAQESNELNRKNNEELLKQQKTKSKPAEKVSNEYCKQQPNIFTATQKQEPPSKAKPISVIGSLEQTINQTNAEKTQDNSIFS